MLGQNNGLCGQFGICNHLIILGAMIIFLGVKNIVNKPDIQYTTIS